jgi:DDE superfamily endonuclease
MPCEFIALIVACAPLFSKSVFQHVQLLLVGAMLSPGKRTVTQALRLMGKGQDTHFQHDHRVLNRAVWSSLAAGQILLGLLISAFALRGPVVLGLDDTIERRRGDKIAAKGIYRDPVRSSHAHFVTASGLRWLVLMLFVPLPWTARVWALPFLTCLCPSPRYDEQRGRAHRTLTERARQMLFLVARWLPGRDFVVTADSSFAALELLEAVRTQVAGVTRLRVDAALYAPAPARQAKQTGRPRKKGRRLPTLHQVANDRATCWQRVLVHGWYGEGARTVEIVSGTCVWYHTGMPAVPIRWVLIRDPQGKFDTQAVLCTRLEAAPLQVLSWFILRWQVDVTFEEARAHLGMETQRQWSDNAVPRTTPCVLGLYALIVLLAARVDAQQGLTVRREAWYAKERVTFSATLAMVRRWLWAEQHFQLSQTKADMIKVPRALFERLTETLCYAA